MTHDAWTDWLASFTKKYDHDIQFSKDHFTITASGIFQETYFEIFLREKPYKPVIVMTALGKLKVRSDLDSLKTWIGDDAADELLKMIDYVQSLGPNVLP